MRALIALIVSLIPALALAASVTLTLVPPTTNEDGTPLTDLAGYKIYWGLTARTPEALPPAGYTLSKDIGNVTVYTITGLTEGQWFFAATAYDTAKNESKYSNEATKVLMVPPSPPGIKDTVIVIYQ